MKLNKIEVAAGKFAYLEHADGNELFVARDMEGLDEIAKIMLNKWLTRLRKTWG